MILELVEGRDYIVTYKRKSSKATYIGALAHNKNLFIRDNTRYAIIVPNIKIKPINNNELVPWDIDTVPYPLPCIAPVGDLNRDYIRQAIGKSEDGLLFEEEKGAFTVEYNVLLVSFMNVDADDNISRCGVYV